MEHSDKIKKAWGKDYSQVGHDMDPDGWYNGANDRVRKTFSVEVVWAGRRVRPVALSIGYKKPIIIKEEKETTE